MFRTAHIMIAGFTQRVGRSSNGVYRLFDECYRRFASQSTLVEYFPWYVSPDDIANALLERSLELQHGEHRMLSIQLVGYSFGGQTAVHVARQLQARGHSVDHLTLCDPVARFGRLGWLRAANPFGEITVPSTVLNVQWFRQWSRRWRLTPPFFFPRSHDVRIEGRPTPIAIRSDREHTDIDNDPRFHRCVLDTAERLVLAANWQRSTNGGKQ